eukprot:217254-Prymnesium_polylepis.1
MIVAHSDELSRPSMTATSGSAPVRPPPRPRRLARAVDAAFTRRESGALSDGGVCGLRALVAAPARAVARSPPRCAASASRDTAAAPSQRPGGAPRAAA